VAARWVSSSRLADDGVQYDAITGLGGFVSVCPSTRVSKFVAESVPERVEFRPS
jgi:hypothetical protein